MAIPERLKLQPVDEQLFGEMSALCDAIEDELEAGETAEGLLQRWHVHASRQYAPYEFGTYWSGVSQETFVLNALHPRPSFDENVVYPEALAVLAQTAAMLRPGRVLGEPLHSIIKVSALALSPRLWLGMPGDRSSRPEHAAIRSPRE